MWHLQTAENNIGDLNINIQFKKGREKTFSEVKDDLKTGDIILVDGKYSYSTVMDILQGSRWGHSAMVVKSTDIDILKAKNIPDLLLWESNTLIPNSAKNLWGKTKNYKEGPMLVSLEEKLLYTQRNFEEVAIAYKPLSATFTLNTFILKEIFNEMIDKQFPKSNLEIIKSVLSCRYKSCEEKNDIINRQLDNRKIFLNLETGDFFRESYIDRARPDLKNKTIQEIPYSYKKDPKHIYCTELIAETYKRLGIIEDCPESHGFVPKDFSDTGILKFIKQSKLEPEILIDIQK